MSRPRRLSPQSVWDRNAVEQAFQEANIKPMHAARLWGHLIRHPEAHWSDVPDMPRAAVALLDQYFTKFTTTVKDIKRSMDGSTVKLLVELQDGLQVEAVVMTYNTPSRDPQVLARQEAASSTSSAATNGTSANGTQPSTSGTAPAAAPADGTKTNGSIANGHGSGADLAPDCGPLGLDDDRGGEGEAEEEEFYDAQEAEDRKRSTLCVSSQVGCQMGCTFCATGTMGLKGNLNAGEIIEQLVHARAVAKVRNIVFMGMGEPLNNYDAVKGAVAMMTDSRFFCLKRRHVTISTVGVIPRIKQLAADLPGVSLALSLHAPTQDLRLSIVPSARAFKLPELMAAVAQYMRDSGQRVFVEYVMLAGVNDGEEQAHQLGQLLQGWDVVLNTIPWNPIYQPEGPFYDAPPAGSVDRFHNILRGTYGVHTTVRQEMGQDIAGACGQLVIDSSGAAAAASGGSGCAKQACGSKGDIEEAVAAGGARTVM